MNVLIVASAAALTALITYLMVVGGPILVPLVIAVLAWYLINALAVASRAIRIGGEPLPAGLRRSAAIIIILLLSWFVVDLIVANVGHVVARAPVYEHNLHEVTDRAAGWLGAEELTAVHGLFEKGRLTSMIRNAADGLMSVVASVGTVVIYVVFLLLEQHSFNKKIAAVFADNAREASVRRMLQRIGREIQTYVWLKTLTSLLAAFASYVVMKIVGVDLAEFWALLIFALNFIPYLGALLGVIFPTALALIQFGTLRPFVVTAVALTVVQFTVGNILEPRLMGKGLNLSPVIMLLGLAVWGTIWGIVGMFLAVPLMVVSMIVFSQFEATRPVAVLMSADGELLI
jgi:predicted PurR-regulated permease PerM